MLARAVFYRMQKISIKGIAIGGVVAVVSAVLLDIPVSLYVLARVDFRHLPPERIQAAVTAASHAHPGIHTLEMLLGLAGSLLGGYVAALIARHDALLNGALSSWLFVSLGIFSLARGLSSDPVTTQVVLLAASPVCALLGGFLGSLRKQPVAQPA